MIMRNPQSDGLGVTGPLVPRLFPENRKAFPLANDETFPHSERNDGSTAWPILGKCSSVAWITEESQPSQGSGTAGRLDIILVISKRLTYYVEIRVML